MAFVLSSGKAKGKQMLLQATLKRVEKERLAGTPVSLEAGPLGAWINVKIDAKSKREVIYFLEASKYRADPRSSAKGLGDQKTRANPGGNNVRKISKPKNGPSRGRGAPPPVNQNGMGPDGNPYGRGPGGQSGPNLMERKGSPPVRQSPRQGYPQHNQNPMQQQDPNTNYGGTSTPRSPGISMKEQKFFERLQQFNEEKKSPNRTIQTSQINRGLEVHYESVVPEQENVFDPTKSYNLMQMDPLA